MRLTIICAALIGVILGIAEPAHADRYEDAARGVAETKIKAWSNTSELRWAVKAQNDQHMGIVAQEIDLLDRSWREGDQALIAHVLKSPLSERLRTIRDESNGLYTEILVMDNKGLLVAASSLTSDYWQGDEDKWQKSFLAGPGAIYISPIGEDESTRNFQIQVSIPIVEDGAPIGAVTVGLDVASLK